MSPDSLAILILLVLLSKSTTCRPFFCKYLAISRGISEAPIINIPSDFVRKTPTDFANNRAVVALSNTVPSTIINTSGVIYSAPGSPLINNLDPKREAIPAATIPLGPTHDINSLAFVCKSDPQVLKKTPIGRITKTTTRNKASVSQRYNNSRSTRFIFAESKINSTEISNTLSDSLKYNNSLILGRFIFPSTIPITTTASSPDS